MRQETRFSLALIALASLLAGCGISAEFIAPKNLRDPLEKGFHTTYEFRYRIRHHGFLGGLFGSSTIDEPKLLYAEGVANVETEPAAFHDTGAPFDQENKKIRWRIPNVRELAGKTLTFTIQGSNLKTPPHLSVPFPKSGRILSIEPAPAGRVVRFTVLYTETIYNLRFFARLGRGRKQEIHPREVEGPGEGRRIFEWDPTQNLGEEETRIPLTFTVTYDDWYAEQAPKPHITPAVRIPRAVVFQEPTHTPDGKVRIPFRTWGKHGLLAFDYMAGDTWKESQGVRVEKIPGGDSTVVWDLQKDGLAPLTHPVRLRAKAGGNELGIIEVPPPKPSIQVLSFRQQGNAVIIHFEAAFVAPDAVRLFAGSGNDQRLVRNEEFVQRAKGLLAFRIDHLPIQETPEGDRILFVFLSAENAAGTSGCEVKIPLVRLGLLSVRQVQEEIEVETEIAEAAGSPELFYQAAGAETWTRATKVKSNGGKLRWAFLKEIGKNLPEEINLRLKASRGEAFGEVVARIAPLHVVPGNLRSRGEGTFEIPVEVHGRPDWVRFEFDLGGRGFRIARFAEYDPDVQRIQWTFWGDVTKSDYKGETAVLRAAFRNPWGFFTVTFQDIQPPFLRLSTPRVVEKTVHIPIRHREGMQIAVFTSVDRGRTFRPLKGARISGQEILFDLGGLGPLVGNTVRVRVAASDASGADVLEEVTVRLQAGIDTNKAYWHNGLLWVKYEVDWQIPEKDVQYEFSVETPEARAPEWEKASVPKREVIDVNRRAFAWDVARDMAQAGIQDPRRLHLRLVIQDRKTGRIVREVSLVDLPPPPIMPVKPTMGLKKGALTFSFGGLNLPPGAPPFSQQNYKIEAQYIDPVTTHFKPVRSDRRLNDEDVLAWARDQSMKAVKQGTWVKLVITLRNNSRITGFALFEVDLEKDHSFFTGEEGF
ncbi:MAG: hypothetical protein ACYTHN_06145 [Planctomycetota bacterium]|jgi:hypothetical protein